MAYPFVKIFAGSKMENGMLNTLIRAVIVV